MYIRSVFSPFLGSAFAGLAGRWLGARGSGLITVFGLLLSFFLSVILWYEVCIQGCSVWVPLGTWFSVSTLSVNWGFYFDPLAVCMMTTVTFVSSCVHFYSLGYMQADPHLPRFMSYLSRFTGFMLILVTAPNAISLLVGWEGIGVCSYLRIGFWYHRLSATKSAQKAMLVNRVSDTALLIGVVRMWWYAGSVDFAVLLSTTSEAYYVDWICFCLLMGAMGKSAQIGLHLWLADAMEGPTPVSARIHAATLVTAGIYLIARTSLVWEWSETGRQAVRIVGCLTSFMAATCGFFQNDLKRVIAYSTCSQLGYMMVSLGASQYGLAIYHRMTHACFKALLFRSAGAVIHAVADVQDIRRHGGFQAMMPRTYTAMTLGSRSLTGWPFLSGFYSKDAILEAAWSHGNIYGAFAYVSLIIVAAFTSYYTFRLVWCSFVSSNSSRKMELPHAGLSINLSLPLVVLSLASISVGYGLSDALIGVGTPFWNGAIQNSLQTTERFAEHMMPSSVLFIPLLATTTGAILTAGWSWPMPWVTSAVTKHVYLFFLTRWQFDFVANQQVAKRVRDLGAHTWAFLDKGVFELLGPRGLTAYISRIAVPAVRNIQTGIVHDYALMLKIAVRVGFALCLLPGGMAPNILDFYDTRTLGVVFLWLRSLPF